MINLKIKTLDSQNHDFTVEDDITVRQFKEHIAEKTNVTADMQRLIYCGRVLMDDKQLREYDVNGKVVHLVQRPPPSARPPGNSSNENVASGGRTRGNHDHVHGGPPMLRAIDLFGAMAIPMNTTPPTSTPSLNPSSTLCMNRITVARHMLECANNIINYLENPERGLNNSSMDILSQQTMESTVFEVGISAVGDMDIPQHQMQNFVQAFQGAVSAAFRQNGISNVTMQQNDPNGGESATSTIQVLSGIPISSSSSESGSSGSENSSANSSTTTSSNSSNEDITVQANTRSRQQTTSTQTLAEVVQQMRTVQRRMEPFIQQYYDLLNNDPAFTAEETTERENAQRTFDRVSEALHYMSHAQHAISDLMLDFQSQTPRHLCCRPILIEQSAYVSSGITAVPNTFNLTNLLRGHNVNNNNNNNTTTNNNNTDARNTTNPSTEPSNTAGSFPVIFDDDSDDGLLPPLAPRNRRIRPMTATIEIQDFFRNHSTNNNNNNNASSTTTNTNTTTSANNSNQGNATSQSTSNERERAGQFPQTARRTERILRPVIIEGPTQIIFAGNDSNRNANNTNNRVTIPVANLVSDMLSHDIQRRFNTMSNNGNRAQRNTNTTGATTDSASTTEPRANTTSATNTDQTQPRVTTITLPTTSTQTRSTSRPQVHIASGTLPASSMRNSRPIPANMLSSFDRFLSCNSHHIRENQTADATHRNRQQSANRTNRNRQSEASTTENTNANTATASSTTASAPPAPDADEAFNIPNSLFGNLFMIRDLLNITPSPTTLNMMRTQLRTYMNLILFNGLESTDENITLALNQAMVYLEPSLTPLSQFDTPVFDSRGSIENLLRQALPLIIRIVMEDTSTEFGTRLLREATLFIQKFLTILVLCIGRNNTELFLTQVSATIIPASDGTMEVLQRHLLQATLRALDMAMMNQQEVQEYLIIRGDSIPPAVPMETDETVEARESVNISCLHNRGEPAPATSNIPEDFNEIIRTLDQPPGVPVATTANAEETLPNVVIGSEPWHTHFPSNWIPVITRDLGRQRRQSPQGSYSDAYISGMSSKRRKLITNSKPNADIPSLVNDGIRNAAQTTSGINTSNLDDVSTSIASDIAVQSSYREAIITSVQERLNTDTDYSAERFPNIKKYFKKK